MELDDFRVTVSKDILMKDLSLGVGMHMLKTSHRRWLY